MTLFYGPFTRCIDHDISAAASPLRMAACHVPSLPADNADADTACVMLLGTCILMGIQILFVTEQPHVDRQLLKHQMLLYGRVARSPDTDPLRNLTFVPGGLEPATARYIRRVGRPRNEWAVMVSSASRWTDGLQILLVTRRPGRALFMILHLSPASNIIYCTLNFENAEWTSEWGRGSALTY